MSTLALQAPDRALFRPDIGRLSVHAVLMLYTALALFPIALILINSVKSREAIFDNPLALPRWTRCRSSALKRCWPAPTSCSTLATAWW